MLTRRPHMFASMPDETSLRLAAAWSGAVGAMLVIMVLVRSFA